MEATFFPTALVVFRETLEAGLIVGIILTTLTHLRAKKYFAHVGVSVIAALALSGLVAFAALYFLADATKYVETVIEAVASVLAAAVLTYVVVWMRRRAGRIRSGMATKMSRAISKNDLYVIMSLPFIAVLREGVETVLFLNAIAAQQSQSVSIIGGLIGVGGALILTWALFTYGKKVSLKHFFTVTSVLLIFVAAGLLAYGIHELEEIGWMIASPEVWNINHILNDKEGLGVFLKALFGYNGNPSLLEISAYGTYLAVALTALYRGSRKSI